MQQLKERIVKEGKVLPGNIIKVDGFLNHRVDTLLMRDIADEFAITPQAVSDMIKKAINRVRRKEGINAVGIPRGIYNCRTRRRGEDDV